MLLSQLVSKLKYTTKLSVFLLILLCQVFFVFPQLGLVSEANAQVNVSANDVNPLVRAVPKKTSLKIGDTLDADVSFVQRSGPPAWLNIVLPGISLGSFVFDYLKVPNPPYTINFYRCAAGKGVVTITPGVTVVGSVIPTLTYNFDTAGCFILPQTFRGNSTTQTTVSITGIPVSEPNFVAGKNTIYVVVRDKNGAVIPDDSWTAVNSYPPSFNVDVDGASVVTVGPNDAKLLLGSPNRTEQKFADGKTEVVQVQVGAKFGSAVDAVGPRGGNPVAVLTCFSPTELAKFGQLTGLSGTELSNYQAGFDSSGAPINGQASLAKLKDSGYSCKYPNIDGTWTVKMVVNGSSVSPNPTDSATVNISKSAIDAGQTPQNAPKTIGDIVTEVILYVIQALLSVMYKIFAFFMVPLLKALLDVRTYKDSFVSVIYPGWLILRNLSNILFIGGLLYLGLTTLFQVGQPGSYRKFIINLVIAALLVNFSLVIAQGVLGIAETIQSQFLPANSQVIEALGNQLMAKPVLDLQLQNGSFVGNLGDLGRIWVLFIAALMAFLTFGAILFLLVVRIVAIWILLMTSPVAYAGMLTPITAKYASDWWSKFLKYAFFIVGIAFFLNIAALFTTVAGTQGIQQVVNTAGGGLSSDFASLATMLGQNLIIIVLLFMGLMASMKTGVYGSAAALKFIEKYSRDIPNKYAKKAVTAPAAVLGTAANDLRLKGATNLAKRDNLFAKAAGGALMADKLVAAGKQGLKNKSNNIRSDADAQARSMLPRFFQTGARSTDTALKEINEEYKNIEDKSSEALIANATRAAQSRNKAKFGANLKAMVDEGSVDDLLKNGGKILGDENLKFSNDAAGLSAFLKQAQEKGVLSAEQARGLGVKFGEKLRDRSSYAGLMQQDGNGGLRLLNVEQVQNAQGQVTGYKAAAADEAAVDKARRRARQRQRLNDVRANDILATGPDGVARLNEVEFAQLASTDTGDIHQEYAKNLKTEQKQAFAKGILNTEAVADDGTVLQGQDAFVLKLQREVEARELAKAREADPAAVLTQAQKDAAKFEAENKYRTLMNSFRYAADPNSSPSETRYQVLAGQFVSSVGATGGAATNPSAGPGVNTQRNRAPVVVAGAAAAPAPSNAPGTGAAYQAYTAQPMARGAAVVPPAGASGTPATPTPPPGGAPASPVNPAGAPATATGGAATTPPTAPRTSGGSGGGNTGAARPSRPGPTSSTGPSATSANSSQYNSYLDPQANRRNANPTAPANPPQWNDPRPSPANSGGPTAGNNPPVPPDATIVARPGGTRNSSSSPGAPGSGNPPVPPNPGTPPTPPSNP